MVQCRRQALVLLPALAQVVPRVTIPPVSDVEAFVQVSLAALLVALGSRLASPRSNRRQAQRSCHATRSLPHRAHVAKSPPTVAPHRSVARKFHGRSLVVVPPLSATLYDPLCRLATTVTTPS